MAVPRFRTVIDATFADSRIKARTEGTNPATETAVIATPPKGRVAAHVNRADARRRMAH